MPGWRAISRSVTYEITSACVGVLFRTACPVSATDGDMQQLREMGVTTMIDLRAPQEIDMFGEPTILSRARRWTYPRSNGGLFERATVSAVSKHEGSPVFDDESTDGLPDASFEVHYLSLLDRSRYIKQLLQTIPPQSAILSLVYQIWDMNASENILAKHVNEGGIPMLYKLMLLTSTAEVAGVMKVILRALESGKGVMFYLKAGKDRTGVVAALLHSLAGATDEEIIRDYIKSDPALGINRNDDMRKLDRSVFSRAPAEGMEATLEFLRYASLCFNPILQAESVLKACQVHMDRSWQKQ
eukprot:jgi/Ulvmu1/2436/UM134_0018.1